MATKCTAYRIVYCGDAADVDQVGIGKLLEEGWELWGDPFIRSNSVYQAMVKPAEEAWIERLIKAARQATRISTALEGMADPVALRSASSELLAACEVLGAVLQEKL